MASMPPGPNLCNSLFHKFHGAISLETMKIVNALPALNERK